MIQKRKYTKGYNLNFKKPTEPKAVVYQNDNASGLSVPVKAPDSVTLSAETYEMTPEPVGEPVSASLHVDETAMTQEARPLSNFSLKDEVVEAPTSHNAYPLTFPTSGKLDYEKNTVASSNAEVTLLIIILTILIPPLGVGLVFGIGIEFWISLLLTLLFYFPGLIYSLIMILK